MADKASKIDVLVSVDDAHMNSMGKVAGGLKAAGLEVGDVMEAVGTISGRVSDGKLKSLSAVSGVSSVERSQTVQLPPADSKVQ